MVFWIPAAIAAASAIGGGISAAYGKRRRKKNRSREEQAIEEAGGLPQYAPTTYGKLDQSLQGIQETGGVGAFYRDLLHNFQGRPETMRDFLQKNPDLVAANLAGSQGYNELMTMAPDPTMNQYGVMSGQVATAAQTGATRAQQTMARSGLGRSAAMANIARQASQQVGSERSAIHMRLTQQAYQNNLALAQQRFDANRQVAQLALGAAPTPRAPEQKANPMEQMAPMLGQALGTWMAS